MLNFPSITHIFALLQISSGENVAKHESRCISWNISMTKIFHSWIFMNVRWMLMETKPNTFNTAVNTSKVESFNCLNNTNSAYELWTTGENNSWQCQRDYYQKKNINLYYRWIFSLASFVGPCASFVKNINLIVITMPKMVILQKSICFNFFYKVMCTFWGNK